MTPNLLQNNAAAINKLYADAEEIMLKKVAKRLARGIDEVGWAEKKLDEVKAMRKEISAELDKLRREGDELCNSLIDAAYSNGVDGFESEYVETGYVTRIIQTIPESRMNSIVRLQDELSRKFNAQHSAILRNVDDQYRRIIGDAVSMQATGTITTGEAIKTVLNRFADIGIASFTDKAGRHWNMDSYAEMAVRTGMMNAAVRGYTDDAVAHGEDLVIVSDHMDECPLCEPWERKVLSLTGEMKHHPDCDGMLDEARMAGLFHPNCLHSVTVYVPGLTDKTGMKERAGYTKAQDRKGYQNRQMQRYMERCVRKWKRRQAVATTPEDERLAKAYVSRWQAKLRQLTSENDLPRKYSREGGRVNLSAAAKKISAIHLTNHYNYSIIKPVEKLQQSAKKVSVPKGYDGDFSDCQPLSLTSNEFKILNELSKISEKTGNEYGIALIDGKFTEPFTSNDSNAVQIPKDYIDNSSLSLFHSHTNASCLSGSDLALLTRKNVNSVTTIAINGDIFTVKVDNGDKPTKDEFEIALSRFQRESDRNVLDYPDNIDWTPSDFNYMAIREQMRLIVRHFGWTMEGGREE